MAMRRSSLALATLLAMNLASASDAATFVDGFDGNAIDPTWWTIGASGGSSIVAINQRLELTQGASGAAGLSFNVPITGDFDARIDYVLLDWPADNKERLALGDGASPVHLIIERVSDSLVGVGSEIYVTDFTGQGILGTPTADTSGTLRLQRTGDVVEGSFWSGSAWQVIGTYAAAGEGSVSRPIGFSIFPGAPVTPGVRVALDNFRLDGPNVPAPEPGALALLAAGGFLLARAARRDPG
jgi:hypothetical protein